MRILIATPHYGHPDEARVSVGYLEALTAIIRDPAVRLAAVLRSDSDLVRARSRIVRHALAMPDVTHLLFWDDDVFAPPGAIVSAILGMLAARVDVVACPYPRKRLHWDSARAAALRGDDPEAHAVSFVHTVTAPGEKGEAWPFVHVENGVAEAVSVHLGFTLISRTCLETMVEHYARELGYDDFEDGERRRAVALFQLVITPGTHGVLLSEDFSFCHRWRAIGGKVHVYVGEGAPLDHHGSHVFRGKRAGLFRETAASTIPAPPETPEEGTIDYEATGEGGRLP